MAWKLKYRCKTCGYEAEVYDGRGLFRQQITAMSCPDCKTIQNIVVGGIIADVAPPRVPQLPSSHMAGYCCAQGST
ncbi:MAG: hypothetical protein IJV20_10210 [Prevotella sp.]|nr:hypothetical protein [Prevotella sp.]